MDLRDPYIVLSETYGVTVGTGSNTLPSIPTDARAAFIHVETGDIRARFNATTGVTQGAGGGMSLFINTVANPYYFIEGYDNLNRMRISRWGNTNSQISVCYLGYGERS